MRVPQFLIDFWSSKAKVFRSRHVSGFDAAPGHAGCDAPGQLLHNASDLATASAALPTMLWKSEGPESYTNPNLYGSTS